MGKNTKNYRQTNSSRSGDQGAQTYAQYNRTPWHAKVLSFLKIRGKGGNY